MTLIRAAEELGWPEERWIINPPGVGPSVNAALARKKVAPSLRKLEGAQDAQVGILCTNPQADETDAPLALVCSFPEPVPDHTLAETHRLAWNFSRTPLLLTVDTRRLRAFSCCELPSSSQGTHSLAAEIKGVSYQFTPPESQRPNLVEQASHALHWLRLTTGSLIQQNPNRFKSTHRADSSLLANLRHVRTALHELHLEYDVIHDLLARIMFIQFLFDRRDSDGRTALNADYFAKLHKARKISRPYQDFPELLADHADCYRLFWHLDDLFNGDLFTTYDGDSLTRHEIRKAEQSAITPLHLELLSDFVSGNMEMNTGQRSLWPSYSFDVIPLEFISSIYEAFVTKRPGTVYTPTHLVDFVLDGILPWNGQEWDLSILDPACGSGIFLVKAFQRIIHRWKSAHPQEKIGASILRSMLERNLIGVDNDSHAVRTASFSLYLAMCDEIDPRHYWTQVRFPRLRGRSLLSRDFFDDDEIEVRPTAEKRRYDVVVGNPPWGRNSATQYSRKWAREHKWPISHGDIGPLFLAKSVSLAKSNGQISLIQPASTLLFNQSETAYQTRSRIFREFTVTEVVNFSALRFGLFRNAVGPAALFTLRPGPSSGASIQYVSPKPIRFRGTDDYRIVIDSYDVHEVGPDEAVNSPVVWSALVWGGRRDLVLLERLSRNQTLNKFKATGKVVTRRGIVRGGNEIQLPLILHKRVLEANDFPKDVFLRLSPADLDINLNPYVYKKDSTDFAAFEPVQLIVKLTWKVGQQRFRAVLVEPATEGILCSRHFVTVRAGVEHKSILKAACLSYNSAVAVYYLFLQSGRFANYRPEPSVRQLLDVPIPESVDVSCVHGISKDQLEQRVQAAFQLKEAEKVLIEDLLQYTLGDLRTDRDGGSRSPTSRQAGDHATPNMHSYCQWFLRVVKAGFGAEKDVCATVFVEDNLNFLPVRVVAFHFELYRPGEIMHQQFGGGRFAEQLDRISPALLRDCQEKVGYQRIARVFDVWQMEGKSVPTVLLVKPDEVRYWTRSIAMRDADDVSLTILKNM